VPLITFAALSAVAWGRFHTCVAAPQPSLAASNESAEITAYPKGRWRLRDSEELGRLVLWVSHILIRYDGLTQEVPFSVSDWQSEPLPPSRSRAEAIALANEVAEMSATDPRTFGALAARYSDEVVTRDSGGSLGGVMAFTFIEHSQVLDALEHTPIGHVTRPVETRYGIHIFYRRPPPPESLVSGSHLVIGHDDARWLHRNTSRRPIPARSREEALSEAKELYELLRAEPELFPALVSKASEDRDADWGGDLGAWSTVALTPYPREVEVLNSLAIGEVAPPMDSAFGIQIVQRTANRPRKRFAAQTLRLRFDPEAGFGDSYSKEVIRNTADALAREIGGDANRMIAARQRVCCQVNLSWAEGEGYWALASALENLSIGQLASIPVEWDFSYWIVQRVAPSYDAGAPPLTDFTRAAEVDVSYLMSQVDRETAHLSMAAVTERFCREQSPPAALCDQLMSLQRSWVASDAEAPSNERSVIFEKLQNDTYKQLGSTWGTCYRRLLEQCLEEWVIGNSHPKGTETTNSCTP
jgi:hypothetical protein